MEGVRESLILVQQKTPFHSPICLSVSCYGKAMQNFQIGFPKTVWFFNLFRYIHYACKNATSRKRLPTYQHCADKDLQ
jgi:hypothetical protein